MLRFTNTVGRELTMSANQSHKDSLIKWMFTIGEPTLSKAKTSFMIYNPNTFDISEADKLSKGVGLSVIHKATPSFFEGRTIEPHLWIGKASTLSKDDASSYLDAFTE